MKIPDTITAKVLEFREKHFEDREEAETHFEQALLDVRRETIEEIVDKAASVFHPYCCGENTNCFDKLVKITKND